MKRVKLVPSFFWDGALLLLMFFPFACGIFFSCSMQILNYSMWDLILWPGIKPRPHALGMCSLSHLSTREVPILKQTKQKTLTCGDRPMCNFSSNTKRERQRKREGKRGILYSPVILWKQNYIIVRRDVLVVQWLGLHATNAGNLGLTPGQGTRSHLPLLKIPYTSTKSLHAATKK